MNRLLSLWPLLAAAALYPAAASAATTASDRLVGVGGYALHFHIVEGQGLPILFETGGGDDATVWNDLLPAVAEVTGATLIAYDRPGFGQSGLDPRRPRMLDNIAALETGLQRLGYDGKVILVGHSLGGFFATLYAARHPDRVQGAVMIDANVACYFTPAFMDALRAEDERKRATYKETRPGLYYQSLEFAHSVELMRATPFPVQVPVIDIVAEETFPGQADEARWQTCHRSFAAAADNRESIVAHGSAHYVYKANPSLVVNAIAKMYASTLDEKARQALLERSFAYNLDAADQALQRESKRRHSENDLNTWGYQLLAGGDKRIAVDVFQLAAALYPGSANVYDSLAEGYEAIGDKAQAITNYRHSLQLNPANQHARQRLQALEPERG